jgi:hypothetical protein
MNQPENIVFYIEQARELAVPFPEIWIPHLFLTQGLEKMEAYLAEITDRNARSFAERY